MAKVKYKITWYNATLFALGYCIGILMWIIFKCMEAIVEGVRRILD